MHWKRIMIGIALLFSIAIGSIVSMGFIRYETLIHEIPLEQAIKDIKSDPNYTSLDEISDDFLQALLAVEDPSFYDHHGIVLSNIVEAFFTNLKEQDLVMGGSTITQQLSKNIYLDQQKTFQRKIAELFFVHDLEGSLTKDEILELYVNIIYFGDGYYGIKEASEGYFKTSPKNLTMAQSTLLAGLPQAPAVYQLSDGMPLAKQRQRIVLDAMVTQKLISDLQSNSIYHQPI
ncbi:MAG: transglycosylase domain-containing protein [Erysipelotrichaceae bacterium]|nr:transglycosylase domain-containing protein [Erysipelotrichaceae bacterium]MCI9524178.1 transglycosylase domain-containing protein [Erysipelotrichaceae bacterium]